MLAALFLVGGGKAAGSQDPFAEVALVVGAAQQVLVDLLQLGQCEEGREQSTGDMQVLFEPRAQGVDSMIEDSLMVEGKRLGQVGHGKPAGVGGVGVGAQNEPVAGKQGSVGDGNDPGARVAAGVAEGAELFQGNTYHTSLFGQFAAGGSFQRLVRPDKAAGQGPLLREGPRLALDEQQMQALVTEREKDDVHCDRGAREDGRVVSLFGICRRAVLRVVKRGVHKTLIMADCEGGVRGWHSHLIAPEVPCQQGVREDRLGLGQQLVQTRLGPGFVAGADVGQHQQPHAGVAGDLGRAPGRGMPGGKGAVGLIVQKGCLVDQDVRALGEFDGGGRRRRVAADHDRAARSGRADQGAAVHDAAIRQRQRLPGFQAAIKRAGRDTQGLCLLHVKRAGARLLPNGVAIGGDPVRQSPAEDLAGVVLEDQSLTDGQDGQGEAKSCPGQVQGDAQPVLQAGRAEDRHGGLDVLGRRPAGKQAGQAEDMVAVQVRDIDVLKLGEPQGRTQNLLLGPLSGVEEPQRAPLSPLQAQAADIARKTRRAGPSSQEGKFQVGHVPTIVPDLPVKISRPKSDNPEGESKLMQPFLELPSPSRDRYLPAPEENSDHTDLYRMAFAACPVGFIVWNADSHIIDWNQAAERIFGWTRAEAMSQPSPHFLVSQATWPHVDGVFRQLLEAEEATDSLNDNVTRDGRTIHCEWHNIPMRDRRGCVSGFVSIVQDITPRKQAEEALQNEIIERKWAEIELERVLTQSEQIVGSITSILITTDEKGLITTWNAAAGAAFGLRTAAALGKRFTDCGIGWDWDIVLSGAAKCTAQQKPVRLDDIPYVTQDGKERFLGVTLNPINHYSDEPKGFLLLAADITARRVLEGQLAHAQKLESIGQLAAGIAHEINTPIQYVGDNTRFLQEALGDLQPLLDACRAPAPEMETVRCAAKAADLEYLLAEIPQALRQSLEGIARVSHIVRAMKDFSHPGTASKTMTDLNRALDSTATVASNEWKYVADLHLDLDSELPLVPCLPADLNQVFLNMIVNAAHAIADVVGDGSQGKGVITVSTRRREDWVEVRVGDTGTGMTEEIKTRIFDPFFTTKPVGRGTGQGLAISHTVIVEKHQGTIHVETAPGRGTTFVIGLPLSEGSIEKDDHER